MGILAKLFKRQKLKVYWMGGQCNVVIDGDKYVELKPEPRRSYTNTPEGWYEQVKLWESLGRIKNLASDFDIKNAKYKVLEFPQPTYFGIAFRDKVRHIPQFEVTFNN